MPPAAIHPYPMKEAAVLQLSTSERSHVDKMDARMVG